MKWPSFNAPGSKAGRFCVDRKEGCMENVKKEMCERLGCMKLPSFNAPGSKAGRFCVDRKEGGTENVKEGI